MDLKELRADNFVNDWFITLSVRDSTRKRYLDAMKLFTEMAGKTPKELILEADMGRISEMTFMHIFRSIERKMRMFESVKRGTPIRYNPLHSHNLRKFFRTTLLHNGVDDF